MKVKLYVCRHEEVEVEIDDKFRKLAVARPWEDASLTDEDYDECAKAVEQASGLPFGERNENPEIVFNEDYIEAVWSAEDDIVILED